MQPVNFPGAIEIKKPDSMTDEECRSIWAKHGVAALHEIFLGFKTPPPFIYDGNEKYKYFFTAWKPSHEDLQALNRGEPIYIQTVASGLPPMSLFTMNENNEPNL